VQTWASSNSNRRHHALAAPAPPAAAGVHCLPLGVRTHMIVGHTPEDGIITPSRRPSGNPPGDTLPRAWPPRQRPGRTPRPPSPSAPRLSGHPLFPILPCFKEKFDHTPTASPSYKSNPHFFPVRTHSADPPLPRSGRARTAAQRPAYTAYPSASEPP
jgi:hypothetical protein